MITYSAPGKIILSGEHAVVYGKPALVSAINLRLKFSVSALTKLRRPHQVGQYYDSILFISQIVKDYLIRNNINFVEKKFDYKIDSQIPISRGMGSSAALSVSGAACFLEFFTGKKFSLKVINTLGCQIEKYFHVNSSGVDVAVSCFGGLIYYRKGFDFLKETSDLNLKLPEEITKKLFLIDTGKPDETSGQIISQVSDWYKDHSQSGDCIFSKIEKATKTMILSLKDKNTDLFAQSIVDNENSLEAINVVSQKTKKIIKDLKNYGVGKITGAGGRKGPSGFILFFTDKKEKMIEYCQKNNLIIYNFNPSIIGLSRI